MVHPVYHIRKSKATEPEKTTARGPKKDRRAAMAKMNAALVGNAVPGVPYAEVGGRLGAHSAPSTSARELSRRKVSRLYRYSTSVTLWLEIRFSRSP